MKKFFLFACMLFFLVGCSEKMTNVLKSCPDAEIDWVDVLMIGEIQYEHHYPDRADEAAPVVIEAGNEIGRVTYRMADRACSNHKMKNGDATFLTEGTPIFEVNGYPASLLVSANNKVYVATHNQNAESASDLYPFKNLVSNIYFQSLEDGSRIFTFPESAKEQFIDAWDELALEDREELINKGQLEGTRVFLAFELHNGVTFRQLYWADTNTFHTGVIGNKHLKDIITQELNNMKK
ncbi:hypothetical protein [Solibacillus sp. FSL H8-0538]|uniref:hypothetical protein n=1 Tax=Solibacillus sp. FSL H8-0538 TaxID=2921400 RepID=UPI0030F5B421